ncbi:MAG: ABC transporter ATP-binding protein [Candidatus Edwardsbacteria bacterium]|nr:ABC transporter ATP-binding protein [Candidatus Edwardsbacteria bacterium]
MKHYNDSKHIMTAKELVKTYQDNGLPVEAVRGIDLEICSGEFAALVGPSGSGKTTFLNLISGLDNPTSGQVRLNGRDISQMSGKELSDFRRDNIGFIFQAYNLIPVLTVEENIEYVMMLQGVSKEERHQRVLDILKEVGLEGYQDRLPPKLSGGQQQRVAVARAMAAKPSIILADEPTANLDSKTAETLMEMMHQLNHKTKMTFIFSTHDKLVMDKAERIVTIKDGRIDSDLVK